MVLKLEVLVHSSVNIKSYKEIMVIYKGLRIVTNHSFNSIEKIIFIKLVNNCTLIQL